jgi:hypothetical protein
MNAFHSLILIENTIAEYQISESENKYKAKLIQTSTSTHLPSELSFWKEGGQWKTNDPVNEHALYQFGYKIDNHILYGAIEEWRSAYHE